ncbi:MAG: protein phosphatase 2C domain-containing protein [Eubacterium sp.]|nr:protein phosphatase 2C domain-containing protein [Eubacterium sp.]
MRFRLYSKSVLGPKYEKMGLNCQDNSRVYDDGTNQFIAVADGHGSNNCFRSDVGSDLAIMAAFSESQKFLKSDNLDENGYTFSETGIHYFKYTFWQEWRRLVKEHWEACKNNPDHEGANAFRYEGVSDKYKARYESEDKDIVDRYLYTAYGTTLIFAIKIEKQILILQIGDGTCVVLMDDGSYSCPVPVDEDNFLNVTASLCEENAYKSIRHVVIDCDDRASKPVAIFLSSDGLDDCYPLYNNCEYLFKLYSALIDNINNVGFEDTEKEIECDLLPELSRQGSQDDISLSYMVCEDSDLLKETYNRINEEYKIE